MRSLICFAAMILTLSGFADSLWVGGTGTWSTASHWSPTTVPNSTGAVVRIDDTPAISSRVTLDGSYTVGALNISAGDTLAINSSRTLTIYANGGISNNGEIFLQGSGSYTALLLAGNQTLNGDGEIVLPDTIYNRIQMANSAETLIHASDHTIRGAGNLLYNTGNATNFGTILAQGANTLAIDPYSCFVNLGTLRAEGSGGLTLAAGTFENAGRTIEIADGSKVTIHNGSILKGGSFAGTGTGVLVPQSGSRLEGVTLEAETSVTHSSGNAVTVADGLVNHGCWNLSASGSVTPITFAGNQTLEGTGEIVLPDTSYGRIQMANTAETLVHAADHTIRGAGNLLANSGNATNFGTILAQGANTLVIDPYSCFVNLGTLRAEGSGGLTLAAGTFENAGRTIEISDGSKVTIQNGSFVRGGSFAGTGTGVLAPQSGSRLEGMTLENGTSVTHLNGSAVTVAGGLVNHGCWNLSASGSVTPITFAGNQTLEGTGEIVLPDTSYGRIQMANAAETLVHAADHTIRGAGGLLSNSGNATNFGTILARGANTLVIDPYSCFVNLGTLRAEGSGGLTLAAGTFENAGRTIEIADSSKVTIQNGSIVKGGSFAGTGTGVLAPQSGSRLEGITLENGTSVTHLNGSAVTVAGGLVNHGRWNLSASGSVTPITFAGNQTLGGTGEIVLPDTSYGRIQMANVAETLVHAADHTIRGAGSLFANSGNLDNYGRILATGTKSLIINPYTLFRNLEGSLLGGTGTFEFPDGLTANAGIISPGLSVGTLTIKGNVSNAETAIHLFELGGAEISESDRLIVEGTLALGGELRLALVGSYIPEPEAEFTLLTATALTGAFSNAIPEAGSIASNVVTDIGICDIVYDFSSSPKTVKVTNIQSSPELLRIFGVSTGAGVNRIDFAPSSLSWMYKLQYRVNLCTGEWADVPGQGPRPGIGRRDTMIHTNDLPCGFYRILGELSDSP